MKLVQKLTGLFLAFALVCSGLVFSVSAQEADTTEDEKIYCNATLDDEFADNRVMVVISRDASLNFHTYSENDFSTLGCVKVTDVSTAAASTAKAAMEAAIATFQSKNIDRAFPVEHASTVSKYKQVLCIELNEASKSNVLDVIAALMERDDVFYAGPDYVLQLVSDSAEPISEVERTEIELVEEDPSRSTSVPNDPYYNMQWALNQINIQDAWDVSTGSVNVTVGILDAGIDVDHPDLAYRVDTNLSRNFNTQGLHDSHTKDFNGHGTQVASLIGALCNNGIGISGVCKSVTLVSLRVMDNGGHGNSSITASAINYATSQGIDVLCCSIGWEEGDSQYDVSLQTVIDSYQGVFVSAAGNRNQDNDSIATYPAYYDITNMIAVGASTANDTKYYISNYGATTVDIFAPGDSLITCQSLEICPARCDPDDHYATGYHYFDCTSAAAPLVAGVAALLLSYNPNLSPEIIKQTIMINADYVTALQPLCVSEGRLNAAAALNNVLSHACILFNYTSISLQTGHTCTCRSCGYSFTKPHVWSATAGGYRCTKCRVLSSFIPADPSSLSDEVLTKLSRVVSGENFAVQIDDDTVLCCVDGQYYWVRGKGEAEALQTVERAIAIK